MIEKQSTQWHTLRCTHARWKNPAKERALPIVKRNKSNMETTLAANMMHVAAVASALTVRQSQSFRSARQPHKQCCVRLHNKTRRHGFNCRMKRKHHHHQPFTPISSPRPKQNANHVTQHSWPLPPTLHPPTHSAHHKEDSPAAAISISTKRKATKKARREEQSCQSLIRPQTICAPRRLGCQCGFLPYA